MDGFNGCLGSLDETHVGMISCAVWAQGNHLVPKLKTPSRAYDASVTYCRQKLGSKYGHLTVCNDKTIFLCAGLIRGAHEVKLFNDYEFTLWSMMQ